MDKLQEKAPNDLTDYRIVRLTDGSTLVGSISIDKDFLRIQNPLQLITTPRMTAQGLKDDNTLAPWVPFTNDKMFVVPKESFEPQPKIESAILYLKTRERPLVKNSKPLEEIVKLAFSQRRKTLKNCLKSVLNQSQTEIDLSQRAEMLSTENFVTLMNDYEKQN